LRDFQVVYSGGEAFFEEDPAWSVALTLMLYVFYFQSEGKLPVVFFNG